MRTGILELYGAVRRTIPDGTPVTALHIGMERTAVATGENTEPDAMAVLEIGSQKTADAHLGHYPPTPGEVENAIATIEDELARVRQIIPDGSTLFTTGANMREIARIAGVSYQSGQILASDAVERIFARLAAAALGGPVARTGIPPDIASATTLLILREFMHHMRFSSAIVKA